MPRRLDEVKRLRRRAVLLFVWASVALLLVGGCAYRAWGMDVLAVMSGALIVTLTRLAVDALRSARFCLSLSQMLEAPERPVPFVSTLADADDHVDHALEEFMRRSIAYQQAVEAGHLGLVEQAREEAWEAGMVLARAHEERVKNA